MTLLEKIEVLVVGAKPVKKPIAKQRKKWRVALFHNCTFFFDLSKDPITPRPRNQLRIWSSELDSCSYGNPFVWTNARLKEDLLKKMGFMEQSQEWKGYRFLGNGGIEVTINNLW